MHDVLASLRTTPQSLWLLALLLAAATPARATSTLLDLVGPTTMAPPPGGVWMSPDGANIYTTLPGSLAVYARNAGTGASSFIEAYYDGVAGVDGLAIPTSVAFSPDGANVYVTSRFYDNTVAVFSRNPGTGTLIFVEVEREGVGGVDGLEEAYWAAVSPDGAHVYVASGDDDAVAIFSRDGGTGALTFVGMVEDGVGGVDGLDSARCLVVSPDGMHVYVASAIPDHAVAAFARNVTTGALTFIEVERDGVGGVDGLLDASTLSMSPDGASLYVGGDNFYGDGVAVFSRNVGTGALTFVEVEKDGVGGVTDLKRVGVVRVSPDGANVYVTSPVGHSVLVFSRNPGTGSLTFLEVKVDGVGGVGGLPFADSAELSPDGAYLYVSGGLLATTLFSRNAGTGALTYVDAVGIMPASVAVAVSPDGAYVYAAHFDRIGAFARSPATGVLTFLAAEIDNVSGVDGLGGAWSLVLSPDGAHVYVASYEDDAVAVFSRNAGTGLLTFVEAKRDGVGGVDGLDMASAVAISPDGAHVYVTGAEDDAVAVFTRNAGSGALTFVEVQNDGVSGVDGLAHAWGIAVSPDGSHVYVTGGGDDAIAIFARNAGTGALTFVGKVQDGVGNVHGLEDAHSIALSPDGASLYASSGEPFVFERGMLAAFSRNSSTGALTFIQAEEDGVEGVDGLGTGLAVSPDGTHVYVGPALAVFGRDVATGALSFVEKQPTYTFPYGLTVSPDGTHVYVPGPGSVIDVYERGFAGCAALPSASCRQGTAGTLGLRDVPSDRGDGFTWSWHNGPPTGIPDFGDPSSTTHYAFCVYDESGPPALVLSALIPAGGNCITSGAQRQCWDTVSSGYRYRDRFATPDGIGTLLLKTNGASNGRLIVKGKGEHLGMPALPLTLPLRAQLQATNGECWGATYSTARSSGSVRFVASPD